MMSTAQSMSTVVSAAPASRSDRWTWAGLGIALFGIPAVVGLFRIAGFTSGDSGAMVVRELVILGLVVLLLWLIKVGERLPFSSIGLRRESIGRTAAGVVLAIAAFVAALVFALAVILPALGLTYGSGGGPARSLAVTFLVVIRAGIAEEIFYRGYAIERIEGLTGNRALAASLPMASFALFHFSQGIAGIIVALCGGAAATAIYLWKRNLTILIAAHFLLDFIPNVLLPLAADT